jgi:hypothetical protein
LPNCRSCGLSLSAGATICPACGSWGAGSAQAAEQQIVRVARSAPPGARRPAVPAPTFGLEPPPWSATRTAVVGAQPAVQAPVVRAPSPAGVAAPPREATVVEAQTEAPEGVSTRWTAVPTDDSPPWWAAADPSRHEERVRRPVEPGSPWALGPVLARNLLIGLVCLVAVLGFTKGATIGRTVFLNTGGPRPTLSD